MTARGLRYERYSTHFMPLISLRFRHRDDYGFRCANMHHFISYIYIRWPPRHTRLPVYTVVIGRAPALAARFPEIGYAD